jgi:DNA-directed RNA polymerase I, II, and III subunit RPABC5
MPVRCFTCGEILANKYNYFLEQVRKQQLSKSAKSQGESDFDQTIYLSKTNVEKSAIGHTSDQLELYNPCCRRHFISHVELA